MSSLVLPSPAKLNLFLKVVCKRPDTFHELETIFERIQLSDEITFKVQKNSAIQITCDHAQVPVGPKNLVYKVALQLKQQYGISSGIKIHIQKRIPVAAGLAGGSSNAATALRGLNQIWGLKLPPAELIKLGAQIGSDVPFFLSDASWALGTSRGDVIKPLKTQSRFWHVVVTPKLKVYTKDVFGGLNLELTKKDADVNIFTRALMGGESAKVGFLLHNDLESSILRIRPGLLKLKNRLRKFAFNGVAFSGSGPSCYGLAPSEKVAKQAGRELSRHYSNVFVVRTL